MIVSRQSAGSGAMSDLPRFALAQMPRARHDQKGYLRDPFARPYARVARGLREALTCDYAQARACRASKALNSRMAMGVYVVTPMREGVCA